MIYVQSSCFSNDFNNIFSIMLVNFLLHSLASMLYSIGFNVPCSELNTLAKNWKPSNTSCDLNSTMSIVMSTRRDGKVHTTNNNNTATVCIMIRLLTFSRLIMLSEDSSLAKNMRNLRTSVQVRTMGRRENKKKVNQV